MYTPKQEHVFTYTVIATHIYIYMDKLIQTHIYKYTQMCIHINIVINYIIDNSSIVICIHMHSYTCTYKQTHILTYS